MSPQTTGPYTAAEKKERLRAAQCIHDMGIPLPNINIDRAVKFWRTVPQDVRDMYAYCGLSLDSEEDGASEGHKEDEDMGKEENETQDNFGGGVVHSETFIRTRARYILGFRQHLKNMWEVKGHELWQEIDFQWWAAMEWIKESKEYRDMCISVGEFLEQ